MDFKSSLENAWLLTKDNLVILIILTLVMAGVSTLTLGILGPVVFAGYTHSIIKLVRHQQEPKIQDLFSQMRLFFPLLGFGILTLIVVGLGLLFFFIPGIILAVLISFFCLYMVPLMVDQSLGLVDAIRTSVNIITQDFQTHAITAIIYIGLCWIGSLVAIGWLLTLPLGTIFIMLVYERVIDQEGIDK